MAAATPAVIAERVHAVADWRRRHHIGGLDAGLFGPRPDDHLDGAEWDPLNSTPVAERAHRPLDIA